MTNRLPFHLPMRGCLRCHNMCGLAVGTGQRYVAFVGVGWLFPSLPDWTRIGGSQDRPGPRVAVLSADLFAGDVLYRFHHLLITCAVATWLGKPVVARRVAMTVLRCPARGFQTRRVARCVTRVLRRRRCEEIYGSDLICDGIPIAMGRAPTIMSADATLSGSRPVGLQGRRCHPGCRRLTRPKMVQGFCLCWQEYFDDPLRGWKCPFGCLYSLDMPGWLRVEADVRWG